MNIVIITGTSRGIGKAIFDLFSKKENYFVISIGRKKPKEGKFCHINMDLSSISNEVLQKFEEILFRNVENLLFEKVIFINNAATIAPIKKIHKIKFYEIVNNFNVNILSQILLIKKFIKCTYSIPNKKIIINLSSGAGNKPIFGWSLYCTSKAAINMFVQCVEQEYKDFIVINYDPGVVDTDMQATIRLTNEKDFPLVKMFREYKVKNILRKPADVAQDIWEIINNL